MYLLAMREFSFWEQISFSIRGHLQAWRHSNVMWRSVLICSSVWGSALCWFKCSVEEVFLRRCFRSWRSQCKIGWLLFCEFVRGFVWMGIFTARQTVNQITDLYDEKRVKCSSTVREVDWIVNWSGCRKTLGWSELEVPDEVVCVRSRSLRLDVYFTAPVKGRSVLKLALQIPVPCWKARSWTRRWNNWKLDVRLLFLVLREFQFSFLKDSFLKCTTFEISTLFVSEWLCRLLCVYCSLVSFIFCVSFVMMY